MKDVNLKHKVPYHIGNKIISHKLKEFPNLLKTCFILESVGILNCSAVDNQEVSLNLILLHAPIKQIVLNLVFFFD